MNTSLLEETIKTLEFDIEADQKIIWDFAGEMKERPAYALEGADMVFRSAARMDFNIRIKDSLEWLQSEPITAERVKEVLSYLDGVILHNLRSTRLSGSSSSSVNLMNMARTETSAGWFGMSMGRGLIRSRLESVLNDAAGSG